MGDFHLALNLLHSGGVGVVVQFVGVNVVGAGDDLGHGSGAAVGSLDNEVLVVNGASATVEVGRVLVRDLLGWITWMKNG